MPPPTSAPRSVPLIITAVMTTITAIAMGTVVAVQVAQLREAREAYNGTQVALGRVEFEVQQLREAKYTEAKHFALSCNGANDSMTCTITNMRAEPAATCIRGVLAQKDSKGVKLFSVPACTGRLEPHATRTIVALWDGGFAKDVCGGSIGVDWEKCTFTNEFVPAETPTK